jgi:4-amino-4-deoxy-L-arabinose transferase-like glycosyltransferase
MKGLEAILLVLGLLILSSILLAIPTMLLWNYVMPSIFGLTSINLYQAMALNVLSGILFKSNVNVKKD